MSVRRFLNANPARPELEQLLKEAVKKGITDEQLQEQRVSFAYGNAPDSPRITKQSVRDATKTMRLISAYFHLLGKHNVSRTFLMIVTAQGDPNLYALVQERNLIRQYDLLTNCVEIGLKQGHISFDKYVLWALNHVAVANISQFGGRFRDEPIYVGKHIPPHFKTVPELMDRFISFIHENWFSTSPTFLAAYALWRMNWVHPFIEGNGRTARAVCYYLLCTKSGGLLPGKKIVPERIREDRGPYYAALQAADRAWNDGNLDISKLESYLSNLVIAQIQDAN